MRENVLKEKSFAFALDIIRLYKTLCFDKKEYVLSKQMLRSGTSVGANIREAEYAQSRADFINKLSIALKEANEADYWIELLYLSEYIDSISYQQIKIKATEQLKLLTSIINRSKQSNY
ncbi:MAG: four helix bundle protein [Flavobacterium sp. BFFFF1]|uniref:four helix bundle protein n=1 Tax=unclassified Flavobacterium TaxID=196869 RepID=UPI000BC7F14A|nr:MULTISPECIES: four helix bundle protein [unclassified Flavobacterium]OYU82214.1 MAG: four helix bundle protein [Flavobacterium sp. BFFFF1]